MTRLAWHVDYWNNLGWTDPFSQKEFSERQRGYAKAFAENNLWTPQFRVNGKSVRGIAELGRAIQAAQREVPTITLGIGNLALQGDSLSIEIGVKALKKELPKSLNLSIALVENELSTVVKAGENSGRTLKEGFVARLLLPPEPCSLEEGKTVTLKKEMRLGAGLNRKNLAVGAFLENAATMEILASTSKSLK